MPNIGLLPPSPFHLISIISILFGPARLRFTSESSISSAGARYSENHEFAAVPDIFALVYRLLNPLNFALGQLAVFQGGPSRTGGKAPLSGNSGRPVRFELAP